MRDYRYSLEKYVSRQSRYFCPECHKRTLTRYVDNRTKQHLADYVGKCNREEKCAYHFTPKMYFERMGFKPENDSFYQKQILPVKKEKPSTIDPKYLQATLKHYGHNNFAIGLYNFFPKERVNYILQKYFVGTAKGRKTIFWQVSRKGEVRTGKIMQYDPSKLKRTSNINWVHSQYKDFNLKQLYFGAHLLVDTKTPVAIAEGEKNAILGALYFPQYNWLAVGGMMMLNVEKLNALKSYDITLFPDKGKAFQKWSEMARMAGFNVKTNDTLEKTSLEEGSDIADLILELKTQEKLNSPTEILKQLQSKNPYLSILMDQFNLVLTA